mmetsp:Transcript_5329/g.10186  ORF Transcript_5329/g.10186 Transcript_5329/m.10186 type:complete len:687 (+) Transcript_5329:250-2310(+)
MLKSAGGREGAASMASMASIAGGKKRKREPSQQQTSKAQRIDGIPADLTPVLLHAVKATRKYMSKLGTSAPSTTRSNASDTQQQEGAYPFRNNDNLYDDSNDVLARVAARSERDRVRQEAAASSRGETPLDQARIASEDATRAFLNGVRRNATVATSSNIGRSATGQARAEAGEENGWSLRGQTTTSKSGGSTSSVPVACLTFLWNLVADSDNVKLPTRRAALALAAELLQRSAECRSTFCTADRLREYIDVVSSLGVERATTVHVGAASDDADLALKRTMQREAAELLSELSDRFGAHYPRLTVAARYLEEREGVAIQSSTARSVMSAPGESSESTFTRNMEDLRRGRDLAIKHGEREYSRVRKILHRADACFEILVPRIHVGSERPIASPDTGADSARTETEKPAVGGTWSDEEEEDDIDWEEGDIDYDGKIGNHAVKNNDDLVEKGSYDHKAAVERTLAVMESSQGVEGGELEIDLGARSGEEVVSADAAASATVARETLDRCVDLLSAKHFPRLAFWVNCLVSADGMMVQAQQQVGNSVAQSSLVVMPSSLRKKRAQTLVMVMGLKSEVARTLASAARIKNASRYEKKGEATSPSVSPDTNVSQASRSTGTNNAVASNNSTGVGVAPNTATSWQNALGIKSRPKPGKNSAKGRIAAKTKQRRIRAGAPMRKSGVQIKLRKGI